MNNPNSSDDDLLREELHLHYTTALKYIHYQQGQINAHRQRIRTLNSILESRPGRLVTGIHRFRNRLFPMGTLRYRAYRIVRNLMTLGPGPLIKAAKRRLPGDWDTKTNQITLNNMNDLPYPVYPASTEDYGRFLDLTEPSPEVFEAQSRQVKSWTTLPLISIVTPTYNTPFDVFKETLRSVQTQIYDHWEWVVADASSDDTIWNYLSEIAQADPRIRPIRIAENQGISANTNAALDAAQGEFIALLDHDDVLRPHALFEIVDALHQQPELDLLYSDEDKLDENGRRCDPFFKPDWSPEMMLSVNVVTHLMVFRRSLLQSVGKLDPAMDGTQDWDFCLRIGEHTDKIHHIPKILYHWRKVAGSTAAVVDNKRVKDVQRNAVTHHLERTGIRNPIVYHVPGHPVYDVYPLAAWAQKRVRRVSIVIPSRDHASILATCLKSIFEKTRYADYEVIVVDTGSQEGETFALYDQYRDEPRFQVVTYTEIFNFSKACNFGAHYAKGELLLFLNNDTEVLRPSWLGLMAQWYERAGIGIVGARLIYPDGRLQHAGVVLGIGGLASHLFITQYENESTIFGSPLWYRNFLAVTAACLMISREAFDSVGGFDEAYLLNYSDVELCLRVHEAGYRIVYTPQAVLAHHESITHGGKIPRVDFERASSNWQTWLENGDPYFNPNLSYRNTRPVFKKMLTDTSQQQNTDLMALLPHKTLITLPDDMVAAERIQERAQKTKLQQ